VNIDVSFEIWQTLTALRKSEADGYDEVIARLILKSGLYDKSDGELPEIAGIGSGLSGLHFKGVPLPNGTKLRATYKGQTYTAEIKDGRWIDSETGEPRNSPSQAASLITGSATNGWQFWQVRRPRDILWIPLSSLRRMALGSKKS